MGRASAGGRPQRREAHGSPQKLVGCRRRKPRTCELDVGRGAEEVLQGLRLHILCRKLFGGGTGASGRFVLARKQGLPPPHIRRLPSILQTPTHSPPVESTISSLMRPAITMLPPILLPSTPCGARQPRSPAGRGGRAEAVRLWPGPASRAQANQAPAPSAAACIDSARCRHAWRVPPLPGPPAQTCVEPAALHAQGEGLCGLRFVLVVAVHDLGACGRGGKDGQGGARKVG